MSRAFLGWLPLVLVAATAAHSATVGSQADTIAELPVTMQDLRPMIDTQIDGKPARFMADSGSFVSIITPGTARSFGLALAAMPAGYEMKGVNGMAALSATTVGRFTLAGVVHPNEKFLVGGSETGGAGLLGQDVLGAADVEYDLPHGKIRLMKPHDGTHMTTAYWANGRPSSVIPIEARSDRHPHTVGTITINGVPIRVTFDTGAASSILSLKAAAKLGIRPNSRGVVPASAMMGVGSGMVPTWIAQVDSFRVGDGEEIRKAKVRIGAIDLDTDMLIGADFFISHRVYVSNADQKMFLTYEGGPIFNLKTRQEDAHGHAVNMADQDGPEPTDADGFSRRGAIRMAQRDLAGAIADYSRAVSMAPTRADYLVQRASAYVSGRELDQARDDLTKAIALDPANVSARVSRATLSISQDKAGVLADLAAADRSAAPAANERLAMGELLNTVDEPDKALAQLDLWIRNHPADAHQPQAQGGRCRARALSGQELTTEAAVQALADCNAALAANPKDAAYLEARGLIELRTGHSDLALKDYDAALATRPFAVWSLYGRGLARLRTGDTSGGRADIDAATRSAPMLPERAENLGIAGS